MITCSSEGNVCVEIDGRSYDFSNSSEYVEFLLLLTSPDSSVVFNSKDFEIRNDEYPDANDKLERYRLFLVEFASKREEIIKKASTLESDEAREAAASNFLRKLSEQQKQ